MHSLVRCSLPHPVTMPPQRRAGARQARPSFADRREAPRAALKAGRAALRRTTAARNRLLASRARHATRTWPGKRRERTRRLLELGGLVVKAAPVELTDDDRGVTRGLLVEQDASLWSERQIGKASVQARVCQHVLSKV